MANEGVLSPPIGNITGINAGEVVKNVIIGLTVSFVALSLGAALGILSGRGAFAGMFSAGVIALITSLLGGTRVQCSGPTAPMSAVTATVVAFAFEQLAATIPAANPDHFINIVIILSGVILLLMSIFRMGKFISLVPNVVISGFMSGIALLIWVDISKSIFGLGGKAAISGPIYLNFLIAAATTAMMFVLPPLVKRIMPALSSYLPGTLLAIIIMTLLANIFTMPVAHVELSKSINSLAAFGSIIKSQLPSDWSMAILWAAFPFALQLALLCYLDTLLTSLVVDKMTSEKTLQNKELMAQGVANSLTALFGGIPGAQATIRSVLMIKENATLRLAGIFVGLFAIVEMLIFQDLISLIPNAVFAGVLIKVGYDVFDFHPLQIYAKELFIFKGKLFDNFFSRHDEEEIFVTNREIIMILGTAIVTVFSSLNVAVGGFTVLFYLHNKLFMTKNPMRDLVSELETDVMLTED